MQKNALLGRMAGGEAAFGASGAGHTAFGVRGGGCAAFGVGAMPVALLAGSSVASMRFLGYAISGACQRCWAWPLYPNRPEARACVGVLGISSQLAIFRSMMNRFVYRHHIEEGERFDDS